MSDAGVRRSFQPLALRLAAAPAVLLIALGGPLHPARQAAAQPAEPFAVAAPPDAASAATQLPAELARSLALLREADAARQQQVLQLQEQVKHLRGQVEWHEAVVPWLGAGLALLTGGLALLASWSTRRHRRTPRGPVAGAAAPAAPSSHSASRPGSLPPAGNAAQQAGGSGAGSSAARAATSAVPDAAPAAAAATTAAPPPPAPQMVPALLERPEFVSSTRPVPQLFSTPDTPAPLLSADALIDLEQQADFFVALGQEQAAVERLLAELRTVEGRSPMPWLKLLEIHRQQGDRVSYQRALDRFRQRFGPHGAEWQDGQPAGRALEDYPEAMARLQALWPVPQDVMALLERLVGGCEPNSVLSLAASQEALLLYQVARSFVPGAQAEPASDVDLLLPMDSAAALSGRARQGGRVDLDLSSGLTPLA